MSTLGHMQLPSNPIFTFHVVPAKTDPASSRPLVVILGWLGCRVRHLRRLIEWYHDEGNTVVHTTSKLSNTISTKRSCMQAKELANGLLKVAHPIQPLVFHAFSNNGLAAYAHLLHHLSTTENKELQHLRTQFKGLVVDSAALFIGVEMFTRGVVAALMGTLRRGKPPAYQHWLFTPLFRAFFRAYVKKRSFQDRVQSMMSRVENESPATPMLVFYSQADQLIPSSEVEAWVKRAREQGRPVTSLRFTEAAHVSIHRDHFEDYTQALETFVGALTDSHM